MEIGTIFAIVLISFFFIIFFGFVFFEFFSKSKEDKFEIEEAK